MSSLLTLSCSCNSFQHPHRNAQLNAFTLTPQLLLHQTLSKCHIVHHMIHWNVEKSADSNHAPRQHLSLVWDSSNCHVQSLMTASPFSTYKEPLAVTNGSPGIPTGSPYPSHHPLVDLQYYEDGPASTLLHKASSCLPKDSTYTRTSHEFAGALLGGASQHPEWMRLCQSSSQHMSKH